ncbi:MAG: chitobiase/beta-hexosaminidase C-terminal domain-containing protein [Desulfobacterales bacterium]|nr:chitobiase/beta-hexosaminidase C-terminal domain-containing protein [Desulfobacterales bacterium]
MSDAARPDTKAPTTTAAPAGGTSTSPVTVTLTANEPATTYFCTGSGCNPTTVYSTALTFSATTTLRFYSKDAAGNTETVKEQVYTIQAQACTPEPTLSQHAGLTWTGNYTICQGCHDGHDGNQYNDVLVSVHYQWKGAATEMANFQQMPMQGKIVQKDAQGNIIPGTSALNAYCINVLGNFPGACESCHVGLGAAPTTTNKENIDCLLCHQKHYKRKKDTTTGLFIPDTANMCIDMNTAVKTVHTPKRDNCLQCHAKAGGGDAFKRGDIALASGTTSDRNYDVHMSSTGGNLNCTQCHTTQDHRVAGRGSDLRPNDLAVDVNCTQCHTTKGTSTGHATAEVNRHVARIACQTCHIPVYAKNASDTAATEATETHRDLTQPEWNAAASRYEPRVTLANNLVPVYRFWDKTSWGIQHERPCLA